MPNLFCFFVSPRRELVLLGLIVFANWLMVVGIGILSKPVLIVESVSNSFQGPSPWPLQLSSFS